jgi:hypothetical protein
LTNGSTGKCEKQFAAMKNPKTMPVRRPSENESTSTNVVRNRDHIQIRPPGDFEDTNEWFCKQFDALYDKVVNFVDRFFCSPAVSLESVTPWLIKMPREFLKYTEMIAEADENSGGWNKILSERDQRRHLLVGILVRILEVKIFGELLFGASEAQKTVLQDLEVSFILEDEGV